MMKSYFLSRFLLLAAMICWLPSLLFGNSTEKIKVGELRDKIEAAWIGQMIGNIYGLPHEGKYVKAPGEENWPYGYTKNLDRLKQYQGAFSDDDTDVEYMYLLQMQKFGPEPSYAQLRDAWMYHIRDRVWLANRAALGLMHFGYTPPFTGSKKLNPHWYQIDPQLINEIWAVTAPGMVKYAASKSEWAARITSDDWGVEPTILYGAMYSAAFFEKDMVKLIEIGLKSLPAGGRFTQTVKDMIALHAKHPKDWKAAWKEMAQKYYVEEPDMTRTIWNANLNGACAILAMLYGDGDFQRTLDLSCALGFDADNQAATVAGLMGVMYGMKGLPANLYLPVEGWKLPFNDRYINITRFDLPDSKISDIIDQTLKTTVDLIIKEGGKISGTLGNEVLTINPEAVFYPPVEFCLGPLPLIETGKPVDFEFYTVANKVYNWNLISGSLPIGLTFSKGRLTGTPTVAGRSKITLQLDNGKEKMIRDFELLVRTLNIAPMADTIYANVRQLNEDVLDSCWYTFGKSMYAKDVSVINDGILDGPGSVFYSLASKSKAPRVDYYGYGWKSNQRISMVALHTGCLEEFGGWFTSLNVQYMNEAGQWRPVEHISFIPALPATDIVFFQPHFVEYVISFDPVDTKAIRIIGDVKIQDHWNKYTKQVSGFTSITELAVYSEAKVSTAGKIPDGENTFTPDRLKDKIKGGWAGQTIGVVYGAPVEFKYQGSVIPDYQNIPWREGYVKYWWDKKPGLFDDIYTDLNFVDAFEKYGLNVSMDSIAHHWAGTAYHLAHANQASRYNILNGTMPPLSGYWKNNPHADDLDFQIEADFIGLMTPGLVNSATEVANRVGHIMNSGDGWYGGVFVSALYSLAFIIDNAEEIVSQAIRVIPEGTKFHECITDVINWHRQYPDDWKTTWFELQKKWNEDIGCPKGVFLSFNIDAKINSAYAAIGLLYGNGDFAKSIDIAARCGQDSDCNPATVGGVLGVMLGYSKIPAFWLRPLQEIEPLNFEGIAISLNRAYDLSYKHALGMIKQAGGTVNGEKILIPFTTSVPVAFEQNFAKTFPVFRDRYDRSFTNDLSYDFTGNGYIFYGNLVKNSKIDKDYIDRVSKRVGSEAFGLAEPDDPYVAVLDIYIDGKRDETVNLPMKNSSRRLEPAWKYQLPEGRHNVRLKWINPASEYEIRINDIVIYSEKQSSSNLPQVLSK